MAQRWWSLALIPCGLVCLQPSALLAAARGPLVTNGGYMEATLGGRQVVLPLRKTSVRADIAAVAASVTVEQHFQNNESAPIEAVYVFPLPHAAAVHRMTIQVGKRTIRAVIEKRALAAQLYQAAKKSGKRATLLEQQRPNIFSQRIANITAGARVVVRLHYIEQLTPVAGRYRFVFPLVVGPRYVGGEQAPPSAPGWSKATPRVPDAARITPRLLARGLRSGHDVAISLRVAGGASDVDSPSHRIRQQQVGQALTVTVDPSDTLPNKDFVLRYRLTSAQTRAIALSHWQGRQGHLLVMLTPPRSQLPAQVPPRELIFVVDNSGSMYGFPLQQAQAVIEDVLASLRPIDRFQIIKFAGSPDRFERQSVAATPANLSRARDYLATMRGGGGTEFLPALGLALKAPKAPGLARTLLFITDGYIGYEREVLRYLRRHGGKSTVFALGIGSSVNRWLFESIARIGRGTAFVLLDREKATRVSKRIVSTLTRPALTDLRIETQGLALSELTPGQLPDLYLDQPVVLLARYRRPARGMITIRGSQAGRPIATRIPVVLAGVATPGQEGATRGIPLLWARRRIAEEMDTWALDTDRRALAERRVTQLALSYQLMSRFTSFVAIDSLTVNPGGQNATRAVPLRLPAGVSHFAAPTGAFVSMGALGAGMGLGGSGRSGGGFGRLMGTSGAGRGGLFLAQGRASAGAAAYGSRGSSAPRSVVVARGSSAIIQGSIDRQLIVRVIRRRLGRLRACYSAALKRNPRLHGRVVLEFVIGPRGTVLAAKVKMSRSIQDQPLARCLVLEMRRWRFPGPQGGGTVTISYPLVFAPDY